jgi:Domain of unknown function (DUF2383)
MDTETTDTLHDIHTATNDVLKGYREMAARAKPDIQPVIHRLIAMHERHASQQSAELAKTSDADRDDASVQGTVNKVVVILRDWLSSLDRDTLPAVRDGEEALRKEYDRALREGPSLDPAVGALLRTQMQEIDGEIAALPKG